MRRIAVTMLLLVAVTGCSRHQWNRSERLDAMRELESYTLVHAVSEGETLRTIADRYYGDPERAGAIARDNGLADPDRIAPGLELTLLFTEEEWLEAEDRRSALLLYNDGVAAMRAGRMPAAEEAFHQALAMDPGLTDAQYNLAIVWMRRGRNEDAEAMLRPLADRSDADVDVLLAWGQSLFYQARFVEAVTAFDRVLAAAPDHAEAAFSRASALGEDGRTAEAERAWEAFLARHPSGRLADRARDALHRLRNPDGP